MASIFVSHSARDEGSNGFFHRAFSMETVKAVYFEFETVPRPGGAIENLIASSNAVFIVLGPGAVGLPHTRSWINWEAGVASAKGRDIWVFEPYPATHDLPIPRFRHYMVFEDHPGFLSYVRQIIRSYDDSAVLPSALAGGTAGGGLGRALGPEDDPEKRNALTLWGAIGGAFLIGWMASNSAASQRPQGNTILCPNPACQVTFQMHTALEMFSCPACREPMILASPGLPDFQMP